MTEIKTNTYVTVTKSDNLEARAVTLWVAERTARSGTQCEGKSLTSR